MFSNAIVYLLPDNFKIDVDWIGSKLEEAAYKGIAKMQESARGFVPPVKHSDRYAYQVSSYVLVKLRISRRKISKKVLNEKILEACDKFEKEEGFKLPRRARITLKDDLIAEMLPKIEPEPTYISAHFDCVNKWLVVHAAKEGDADELTACLRDAFGGLPVIRAKIMSSLLSKLGTIAQSDFELGNIKLGSNSKFKDRDGSSVTVTNRSTYDELIGTVMSHEYDLVEASIDMDDRITAKVNDADLVKSFKLSTDVIRAAGEGFEDTEEADQFDSDVVLYGYEFAGFYKHLAEKAEVELTYDKEV